MARVEIVVVFLGGPPACDVAAVRPEERGVEGIKVFYSEPSCFLFCGSPQTLAPRKRAIPIYLKNLRSSLMYWR